MLKISTINLLYGKIANYAFLNGAVCLLNITFFKEIPIFLCSTCRALSGKMCTVLAAIYLADPGARAWTYKWKNCSFNVRLFSCFVFHFILRSSLFTQIEIVVLTTTKGFLQHGLLFSLWVINCTFAGTTKPMNIILQTAQGLVASRNVTTRQNFLFWSLSIRKIKLMPEYKHSDSNTD